jgi:predicted ester cyclase
VEFPLILFSGDYIIFEGVSRGTFTGPLASPEGDIPPTGRSVVLKFVFIAKVTQEGLIEEDRTYFDTADFMRQLGLLK